MMIGNRKEEGRVCTVLLHVIRKSPTPSESWLPAILNWKKHKSIPGFTPSLSIQSATKQCRDSNPSQWHQQKKTLPLVPPQPRSNWHLGATKSISCDDCPWFWIFMLFWTWTLSSFFASKIFDCFEMLVLFFVDVDAPRRSVYIKQVGRGALKQL